MQTFLQTKPLRYKKIADDAIERAGHHIAAMAADVATFDPERIITSLLSQISKGLVQASGHITNHIHTKYVQKKLIQSRQDNAVSQQTQQLLSINMDGAKHKLMATLGIQQTPTRTYRLSPVQTPSPGPGV